MLPARFTRGILRTLDWIAARLLPPDPAPPHQRTGRRGEEDAYFHLRGLGYVMVAQNFRSPHHRGEIDLVGYDGEVLCFIEVKTRTSLQVKSAAAAVDLDKMRDLSRVARDYLRHAPAGSRSRFDVVTVYYDAPSAPPRFDLFRNAFPMS